MNKQTGITLGVNHNNFKIAIDKNMIMEHSGTSNNYHKKISEINFFKS